MRDYPMATIAPGEWRDALGDVIVGDRGTFTWTRPTPRRGQFRVMLVVGAVRSHIILIRADRSR